MTQAVGLLTVLREDERRHVLAATTRRRFSKGEVLFHEGDPGDSLHVVAKGHVAIRVGTAMGDVAMLTVLGPHDAFGEQALLTNESRRTASAVAMDPVETRVLRRDEFAALIRDHPEVAAALIGLLAEQVRRLSDRLTEALFVPAETRVVRRVVDLAVAFSDDSSAEGIRIPVTQDDIAAMAGTTRPTANRALKACAATGALTIGRGRLEILDLAALEDRAR
jgi:CRP/FNR family cyclic AMP-dependent transcriptional regulator